MRIVIVASAVTSAIAKSCRLCCHRRRQPGMSNSDQATAISSAAIAGSGIRASSGALDAISSSSHSEANTAASGVRAPASRFGIERFSEPQET